MSQNVIIAILATTIVAGGGVWYYQTNVSPEVASVRGSEKSAPREEKGLLEKITGEITGSFADILGRGDSVQCSFEGKDPDTGAPIEGEVYVDGENYALRADTEIERTQVMLNMIQKGQVMYLWTDDAEAMQPIKIDVTMFGDDPEMKKESPIEMLKDPANGIDVACKGWSAKASKFEPPADIEFFDMFGGMMGAFGQMMQKGMMEDSGGEDVSGWEETEDPFADEGGWGSENY